MPNYIDLFCGVGGIRRGMDSQQNFQCVFSSDINEECQRTYQENYGDMPFGDITLADENLDIPDHDILCGGFPCQPFSICGLQHGFEDTRGTLFFDICRILRAKQPEVVFLENVKHLVHHDRGNTLDTILNKLRELGYNVSWRVLNAVDFGVPQNRERIIIIGSLHGRFDFDRVQTVDRVNLVNFLDEQGEFEFLDPDDYTILDNPVRQRGSGLMFAGYRNRRIRVAGVRPGTEHLSRVHKQPNRIYSVFGTHPTLPSQETSGRFFVLLEDGCTVRKLTLNECWRIMGFPEEFIRPSSIAEQYKQLGNSVCVPMIAAVAQEINNQFFGGV